MMVKTKLLLLLSFLSILLSCRRNNMETYIEVRLSYVESGKPVSKAPILLIKERYLKQDRQMLKSYSDDTFYTEANGMAKFYTDLSDKREYRYKVRVLHSDSNSNSKNEQVVLAGYPNFFETKVNKPFPVKVFIVHNTVSAATDDCTVYWTYSEFPGSKLGGIKVDMEKGRDTMFYINALNQHTMNFSIYSYVKNPNNSRTTYLRNVRVATDLYSTSSIILQY